MKVQGMKLMITAVFAVAVLASFASAWEPPVLRAESQTPTCLADGTTLCTIAISADSTPMDGQNTMLIDLQYALPQANGYQFSYVSTIRRPTDDFFVGYNTIDFAQSGGAGRIVTSGVGPGSRVGNVVFIQFRIAQTNFRATQTQTTLQFDSDIERTHFGQFNPANPDEPTLIAPTLQSTSFTIMPSINPLNLGSPAQTITPTSMRTCNANGEC